MTSVLEQLLDFLSREEFVTSDFHVRSGVAFCGGLLGTLLRNGANASSRGAGLAALREEGQRPTDTTSLDGGEVYREQEFVLILDCIVAGAFYACNEV